MQIMDVSGKRYAPATAAQKEEVKARIKKMQKEGEQLIKGMFEFSEASGGWFEWNYRFYPGEPIRRIKINHGEICDLPMDVVKALNNTYKKVRVMKENADKGHDLVEKFARFRFTPMDVM